MVHAERRRTRTDGHGRRLEVVLAVLIIRIVLEGNTFYNGLGRRRPRPFSRRLQRCSISISPRGDASTERREHGRGLRLINSGCSIRNALRGRDRGPIRGGPLIHRHAPHQFKNAPRDVRRRQRPSIQESRPAPAARARPAAALAVLDRGRRVVERAAAAGRAGEAAHVCALCVRVATDAAAVRRRRCVVGLPTRGSFGAGRNECSGGGGQRSGAGRKAAAGGF